jgi:serine/threonine-protein kinase
MHAVSVPTAQSSSGALDLPRALGRYVLFELIGQGGMAQIYLARKETELGATRLAVVKEILPAYADDPRFSEMLIHEAKLAARLSHRHIVQVHDLGRAGGDDEHLYIAMEYVEGFDLNALLRKCTENSVPLPAEHALGIVADVLEGLDYAHRRADDQDVPLGIVHRDVSPSNVLISYEGEVKLCDFGIAHANDLVREGSNEALKGKAGYMSPEHARGDEIDARADVFAAGIILWELLAGKRMYKPRSETPLLEQARAAVIPPIPDKGLPSHARLAEIVTRALAKDRDERYPTAAAFLRDLEEYLASAGLLASRLKLGEWMAAKFGTKIVEERRASERRLPKSAPPPPRASERVRVGASAHGGADARSADASGAHPGFGDASGGHAASAIVPSAPPVPRDLLAQPTSDGAMRAFQRELGVETPTPPMPGLPLDAGSLVGTAMDVPPSSSSLLDASAGEPPSSEPDARARATSDAGGPPSASVAEPPADALAKTGASRALLFAIYVAVGVGLGLALVALARVLVH